MAQLTYTLPTIGNPNTSEAPLIRTALSNILTDYNSNIDLTNLASSLKTYLGLGSTGRGKSIIATTESRTNVAYGTLTTPDQVTVTLPTDGLIHIGYQATWQESVTGAARAAIFLGANQLQIADAETSTVGPRTTAAVTSTNSINVDVPLASFPGGLCGIGESGASGHTGDATTGQVIGITGSNGPVYELNGSVKALGTFDVAGGPCSVFATAGSYTVSVQFKATSGTVTVKNRKLWVWTIGF